MRERSVHRTPGGPGLRVSWSEDVEVGGWLALGIFGLLLLSARGQDLLPSPARMFLLLVWPIVIVAFAWTRRPLVVAAYCIAGGFLLRWADFWPGGGSDVLPVVTEWIQTFIKGGNPYDHSYVSSRPPGSPVPYPPVQFLVHLPGYLLAGHAGVRFTQVAAALGVMSTFGVLAWRGAWSTALPALALYAGLANLVNLSVDAGNDTGTGAVLLLAVLGAWWATTHDFDDRSARLAGLTSALALGMKQTTLFVVLMVAAYVWRRGGRSAFLQYALAGAMTLAVVSAVFLLRDPFAYVRALAYVAGDHSDVYGWNLWVFAGQMGWPVIGRAEGVVFQVALTVVASAIALLIPLRRIGPALIAGITLTLIVLFVARWTTYSYFGMLAPVMLVLPILVSWERRSEAVPPPAGMETS